MNNIVIEGYTLQNLVNFHFAWPISLRFVRKYRLLLIILLFTSISSITTCRRFYVKWKGKTVLVSQTYSNLQSEISGNPGCCKQCHVIWAVQVNQLTRPVRVLKGYYFVIKNNDISANKDFSKILLVYKTEKATKKIFFDHLDHTAFLVWWVI